MFTVVSSTLTHTVPSKSVTDEFRRTGAGLRTKRTEASWTAGYGAVSRSPARQTLTVTVPMVTCGVVGTVNTHLGTLLTIVTSWTSLITIRSSVTRKAITFPCHMMAAVRLATGRAGHTALVPVHTSSAFVLTGDSPVAWTTHTSSGFFYACVTVGAMLEAGLITVASPQTL